MWLSAVIYNSNNIEKIKNIVLNLDFYAAIKKNMAIKKNIKLVESKNW